MQFSASYDRATKVISALVAALLLTLTILLPWFAGVLMVLILTVAYSYTPLSYTVARGELRIERPLGRV